MDTGWDAFLETTVAGQFQQSSAWACAKEGQNWRVLRVVLTREGRAMGGFQAQYRRSRFGTMAYVSKGPVLKEGEASFWPGVLNVLVELARMRKWSAVVLQPPDESSVSEEAFSRNGWRHETTLGVIDASLWFDLAGTPETILAKMPGYNRTLIRQAGRKGVAIREGSEADIPLFFQLMLTTCRRQGEKPHPSSEAELLQVWRAFFPTGRFRLAIAEKDGAALAGLTTIAFGNRITLWKKGWTAESGDLRPNHALYHDALCWGQKRGARFCDFYSVRRDIAVALQTGVALSEEQARSRDRFHLGFGGRPVLLPQARIWLASRPLQWAYAVFARWKTRR